ncbi:MAG TPA: S9 family peptidase, partial [Bacteroidetes bacterium]|nr:S9 family peptidase [Bacteroidota bacterium]
MIRIFVIAILCSTIQIILYAGNGDRELTMEEIFYTSSFSQSMVTGINFLNNGDYSILERSFYGMPNIIQYDIVTGAIKDTIFRGKNLIAPDIKRQIKFFTYILSSDESKILLATRRRQQYRRSFFAEYFIWDRDFQTLTPLTKKGQVMIPAFSPDGNKVSFVYQNNIYIKDLDSGQEYAVTSDGEKNNIINGRADWVYEEEFQVTRMHYWAPDGKNLAYVKFNEKEVKEYVMRSYGSLYPKTIKFKYPKAGEKNSVVSVHVFNIDSQATLTVGLAGNSDRYIPRIRWTKDPNRLAILKMNRRQNELELLFADASTGKAKTVLVEKNKSYIDVNDHWHFLDDNKHFLWVSEVSGYNHVYLYDMQGKLKKQITSGEWDVTNVYGFDEVNEQLYFQTAEVSPMERYLYKVGINGKDVVRLGSYIGWCKGVFNKTFEYFINTHTDINSPQRVTVNKVFDGSEVRVLEDNESINTLLEEYNITNPEFFQFKTSEGIDLNGFMIKPPDFNPRKKYPVLMWVY